MAWPIPPEGTIAARYARKFEQVFSVDDDGNLLPDTPLTGPGTTFGAIAEVADETHTELYLYQASLAQELMPDTATYADGGWLPRHGAEWGVPQLQPTPAVGNVIFVGTPTADLPAAIETTLLGVVWTTTTAATIPASGAVSIPVVAEVAGSAGNLAAGAVLTLVSAVNGITQTTATVDVDGLEGGTDLEDPEAWRARILAKIRTPGAAGTVSDYTQWATDAGAGYVQVVPQISGAGTVGVYVGMPGPAVPTAAELATIDSAIQTLRPVTAAVVTLACALQPVPVTLALSPDTVSIRAAATLGLQGFFLREGLPGTPLVWQRLNDAIEASDGEYTHALLAPAGDVQPAQGVIPTLGAVTFVAAVLPQRPAGVVG